MAKLDALKEKLAALKLQLVEKLEKIPVLKKLFAKGPPAEAAATSSATPARSSSSASIGQIYKGGGTFTRMQVFFFILLVTGAIASVGVVGGKLFKRLKGSPGHEETAAEVTHGIGEVQRRMEENAKVLSLGKFTVNAFIDEHRETAMSIDIWLRVSGVEAANFVQSHEEVTHDKAMDAINELYVQKTNLLTEQGKEKAKLKIASFLNTVIPKGRVEEVFFHNLVVQ